MRFRKSIKIAPGLKINLSKSGISTTIGGKGLSVNIGNRGTYLNTGIPGTGISNRTKIGGKTDTKSKSNYDIEYNDNMTIDKQNRGGKAMQADEFIEKIKLIGGKPNFLNKASYKLLSEMISDNEELVCASSGTMIGRKQEVVCAIVVTNKNFYAASSMLLTIEKNVIPLDKITGITTSGILTQTLEITEGTTFYVYKSLINVQDIINAIKNGQSGTNIPPKNEFEKINELEKDKEPDEFDKIRKYKTLLDDGIISQEEFDKKKAELLKL
jgi:hypothetical protein